MNDGFIVRIMKTEIQNIKNVRYGEVKYMNNGCIENKALIENSDIVGIYGQNGSGKTALIEALDILKYIISGKDIPFNQYAGILSTNDMCVLTNFFFVKKEDTKYKVKYEATLKVDTVKEKICVVNEKLVYWTRGVDWKTERDISFYNPYYECDDIIEMKDLSIESEHINSLKKIDFLFSMQNLAIYCSQRYISVFFNQQVLKKLKDLINHNEQEIITLYNVIEGLYKFGNVDLHVIKVNQLSEINDNRVIPLNMHCETDSSIIKGCLPLFTNGQGELPEETYGLFKSTIKAINIAIKAIIPNLQIELEKKNEVEKEDEKKYIQVEVYSNRSGKRFLLRYESEGIKRIISLLNYLISVYNNPGVCLVVDELDSGIFEYLLGELLGVLQKEMKGQLIFTSHNLRALEKLDYKNIICSTTNPENRYIRLSGVSHNNNKRDFYIRTLVIGGQKEELYDEDDLQTMGYALRKAGNINDNNISLQFSSEFLKNIKQTQE